MTLFQATIYGLVQGIGEFLPISSSGHLAILPWLFGWDDPGLAFDVALHFGTLLAVIIYFWKDLWQITKNLFGAGDESGDYPKHFAWLIVFATIPGAMAGYFLEDKAETVFRHPLIIASALAFAGLLLYLVDKYAPKEKQIKKAGWLDAVIIGTAQAFAIIPGVSRSGATIIAGRARELDRVSAAKFSFLLSIPIIAGAFTVKLGDFMEAGIGPMEVFGIAVSAVSGYLAIAWLLKIIAKVSYKGFFWYRLGLAAVIVVLWFFR